MRLSLLCAEKPDTMSGWKRKLLLTASLLIAYHAVRQK
jgi:hypothetical protein